MGNRGSGASQTDFEGIWAVFFLMKSFIMKLVVSIVTSLLKDNASFSHFSPQFIKPHHKRKSTDCIQFSYE